MIRRARNAAVCVLLPLVLAGCFATPWVHIQNENRVSENAVFRVTLPVGWMRADYASQAFFVKRDKKHVPIPVDRITFTRDGFNLEDMDFIRFDAKDAFPHLQKPYTGNMLPSEAADLLVADLKKSGLDSLTVHSNQPVTVAGKTGFRLHISHKNANGLRFEHVIYGFGHKSNFYRMSYSAPSLHYFSTYRSTFNEVVQSFRLKG